MTENKTIDNHFLNQIVIVRTYSAGVFYGKLVAKNGKQCLLHNARVLWEWDGAFTISELSTVGTTKPQNCKFSTATAEVTLEEVIQINKLSDEALKTFEQVKDYDCYKK